MRPVSESAALDSATGHSGSHSTADHARGTAESVHGRGSSPPNSQNTVIHERSGSERFAGLSHAFAAESGGSLQDRVFRALRGAILAGELPAGEKITEQDVAAALQVSRTPLREAFRRLEAEGLVSPSPSRGVLVRGLTWQDFEDIYEIRAALEPLATRRTAMRVTPELIEELRGHLELAEFFLTKGRYSDVEHENALFHRAIYRACGNVRLRDTLAELSDYVHRSPLYQRHGPGSSLSLLEEHQRILDALATGDVKGAERAARDHSVGNRRRVVDEPSHSDQHAAD
jgi:DNA-binding GntR family transcriptional regulator